MIKVHLITLWQPWASVVVTPHPSFSDRGIKEYETRHWETKVFGRVLIHAAKKWDKEIKRYCQALDVFLPENLSSVMPGYSLQCIVGSVVIEKNITSEHFKANSNVFSRTPKEELFLGNWAPGRHGWKLATPVLFDEPIPWKGVQTPFTWVPLSIIPEKYHKDFK